MAIRCKILARDLIPPVIWRLGASVKKGFTSWLRGPIRPTEKDASWYNKLFRNSEKYRCHYTKSHYYFIWSVIADRLLRDNVQSVLDIGCGPGQFALLLRDKEIPNYYGIDLSDEAVHLARSQCPSYRFVIGSIFESDVIETVEYDVVTAMEFLEHVQDEMSVLQRIPKGKKFFGTVPNFACESHVRFFSSCQEVEDRYGSLFEQIHVDALPADPKGTTFFLLEGVRA